MTMDVGLGNLTPAELRHVAAGLGVFVSISQPYRDQWSSSRQFQVRVQPFDSPAILSETRRGRRHQTAVRVFIASGLTACPYQFRSMNW